MTNLPIGVHFAICYCRIAVQVTLTVLMLWLPSIAAPGITNWTAPEGATGDWHDVANWDNGIPSSANSAYITKRGMILHDAPSGVSDGLSLEGSAEGATLEIVSGELTVEGVINVADTVGTSGRIKLNPSTTLTAWGDLYLGRNGMGTLEQTGGYLALADREYVILGSTSTSEGRYDMSGGTLSARGLTVGDFGSGTVEQTGGVIDVILGVDIGDEGDAVGNYYLSGAAELHAGDIRVGRFSQGNLIQSGGLIDTPDFYMGVEAASVGTYSLESGQLTSNIQAIGWFGDGKLIQTGGSNDGGTIYIGRGNDGVGTYAVSGGTLDAQSSLNVGVAGSGTLRVTGANSLITTHDYSQNDQSTLVSELTAGGISLIAATDQAAIDGTWVVTDIGAAAGRYDILTAEQGISGMFDSVILPTGNWDWGIENNKTLWVALIPEPGSLVLAAIGLLGLGFCCRNRG